MTTVKTLVAKFDGEQYLRANRPGDKALRRIHILLRQGDLKAAARAAAMLDKGPVQSGALVLVSKYWR